MQEALVYRFSSLLSCVVIPWLFLFEVVGSISFAVICLS